LKEIGNGLHEVVGGGNKAAEGHRKADLGRIYPQAVSKDDWVGDINPGWPLRFYKQSESEYRRIGFQQFHICLYFCYVFAALKFKEMGEVAIKPKLSSPP